MALIKCNECGHMISEKAKSCPKCGAKNIKISNVKSEKNKALPNKLYSVFKFTLKSLLALLYIFVVVCMAFGVKSEIATPHNLYHYPINVMPLILVVLFGMLVCRYAIKSKKIRKYCMWITVIIPIVVITVRKIEVEYLNETAIKYNTIEHLTENIDGTVWINEKGGIKMSFENGFVHVQTKQSNDNWNPAQSFEYEIMESEGVNDVRKKNILYLNSVKFPAIRWKNVSVDYKDMTRKTTMPDGGNEIKEEDIDRKGYHYFIPLISKYYWYGFPELDNVLHFHRMKFVKKNGVGAVFESNTEENKQEVVKMDSTVVCVSAGDNYERKTISDLKRMGLNGPVCFMSIETLFSEKDGSKRYYQQYEFDKNGMLTETMNERVGFPVDMTAEGKQSGCTYVDGKLISSIVEDENASLSSYKYEYVDYDKERTDVYRINEQNEKELAMTLFFHENGYLRQKTVYWDNSGDFESYDEFGVMIDETNSVIKKTDSYGNWKEKEVMEEGECIYKIIRGISYY